MKRFKHFLVFLLIGKFFTEKEVKTILSEMQYDMAQNVLRGKENQTIIIPLDYWKENNRKYNTNLYNI